MITEKLQNEIYQCEKCQSILEYKKFPIESHGKINADYMIVSEAPGEKSISKNRYWMGKGGQIIRSVIREFGIDIEDIFYMTDIVKCWPNVNGKNRKPSQIEISNCASFLDREITELKPKFIIVFGKTAAEYFLCENVSMRDAHGKIYKSKGTKVLVLYHPSRVNQFMALKTYKSQLQKIFSNIINGGLIDSEIDLTTQSNKKQNSRLIKQEEKITGDDASSFVYPATGNSITEEDIRKGYLRITVDYKKYFPDSSSEVIVMIGANVNTVRFIYRDRCSHLLKLGKELMAMLNIKKGDFIKVKIIDNRTYKIEKLLFANDV